MTKRKYKIQPLVFDLPEDMELPDLEQLLRAAVGELITKYPEYGNTFRDFTSEAWNRRLENEVEEYKKALSPAARRRKAVNIFNLAAMAYQNASLPTKQEIMEK